MPAHKRRTAPTSPTTYVQFQDGMPASQDVENQIFSFSRAARGNNGSKALHQEKSMNDVRHKVGLYKDYKLANAMLAGAPKREAAFKTAGTKQLNHVRGTDGWYRSMLVIEVRAIDTYFYPWLVVVLNALLATLLKEIGGIDMDQEILNHWGTVYSLVLTTALAFLLVFRLNRVAIRFWETRTMWGNVTHNIRNLVGGILVHCRHSPQYRDEAIRWGSSFCVAAMHFIRNEYDISSDELAGLLTRDQIDKMQDANHAPLYAASMCRNYLKKAFAVDADTPPSLAYGYAIQMNTLEELINSLVAQVSGMERVRSTPLPIVYVTHLRTCLFAYCMLIPYVWVVEWGWSTVPLVAFTAFALFGIEGASNECEIPFDRSRPNHLAIDAYCLVILDAIQGLVVHDANVDMSEKQNECNEEEEAIEAALE